MNKAINVPVINKMMADFEKENMKTEMMQEIMGEMLDDAMEEEGDVEESDKIVSQVLDEIGVSFSNEIPSVASGTAGMTSNIHSTGAKIPTLANGGAAGTYNNNDNNDSAVEDLQRRFNNLDK